MLRRLSSVLFLAVMVTACVRTPTPVKPAASPKPKASTTVGATTTTPTALGDDVLAAPKGASTELAGKISLDAAYAVSSGAAQLISDHGGGFVSDQGAGLIANNGSGLVANNAGNLVGRDPAQISSHLGAALTGKVKLISDNGGGLIANNGGGIISDNGAGLISNNGGGLTGKTKRTLLEAAAAGQVALPVGGMLVGVRSLANGAFLPLGVDRAGKPVYAIYTNAKGEFTVHLPENQARNVLVVASVAGTQDTRLAVDLLARSVNAQGLLVDEGTTVITTYLRRTMASRLAEVFDPDPCHPVNDHGSASGEAIRIGLNSYESLFLAPEFKGLPREARRRVLIRFADAVIANLDVEGVQIATGLEPGAKITGAALPVLKQILHTLEAAAAERLNANPKAFDDATSVKIANLDRNGAPPVQVRTPTDLSEFLVGDFLSTNDLKRADLGKGIMLGLGLPAQNYIEMTSAGASMIASMVQVLSDEVSAKAVRETLMTALADEVGATGTDAPCVPLATPPARTATVSVLAGDGTAASKGGAGTKAAINHPAQMVVDPAGFLLVAEAFGEYIRKIDLNDPTHPVTIVAGAGSPGGTDGPAKTAKFDWPCGLALDGKGGLYVSERNGHRIRKVADYATDHAVVSTIAGTGTAGFLDGAGTAAKFNAPEGLAMGPDGTLYVADTANNRIRKVAVDGTVSTLAGNGSTDTADGIGTEAGTRGPRGIAFAPGGYMLTADSNGSAIRHLTLAGAMSLFAGTLDNKEADGTYWTASFSQPVGLAVDAGGTAYVADMKSGAIRLLSPQGFVSTIANLGNGNVEGLALGPDGTIYVSDSKNHKIQALKLQ
ncbi:MAG: hypothetical protein JWM80_1681 [Cyanobacteria bacterium RYN_339]|nr:hypothetical protein [Cyanobacteria bacterium RYN_339]